jgi:hypothetical protein
VWFPIALNAFRRPASKESAIMQPEVFEEGMDPVSGLQAADPKRVERIVAINPDPMPIGPSTE